MTPLAPVAAPAAPKSGLACPHCGSDKLPVGYTRRKGGAVRRVRVCAKCGRRLPTVEKFLAS